MKVAHVTYSNMGGAGRSARAIHEAQLSVGVSSDFIAAAKNSVSSKPTERPIITAAAIADQLIGTARVSSLFSVARSRFSQLKFSALERYNILNFHWTPGAVNLELARQLSTFGSKIVWTLHDYRSFTGGCHFPSGCRGFELSCQECPQVKSALRSCVETVFLQDLEKIKSINPVFVAPSKGIMKEFQSSKIGSYCKVEYIPNPFPSEYLKDSLSPQSARRESYVYLFVAENLDDVRKGADEVARWWLSQTRLNEKLLVVGSGGARFRNIEGIEILGRVTSESLQSIYQKSNALIFGSSEDNAPNVIAEAIFFGLPVFCSNKDMLSWLSLEKIRVHELGDLRPSFLKTWSAHGSGYDEFLDDRSPQRVAIRYLNLYQRLFGE